MANAAAVDHHPSANQPAIAAPDWRTLFVNERLLGAVDLAMYLLRLDFVTAVKRFQSNCSKFSR